MCHDVAAGHSDRDPVSLLLHSPAAGRGSAVRGPDEGVEPALVRVRGGGAIVTLDIPDCENGRLLASVVRLIRSKARTSSGDQAIDIWGYGDEASSRPAGVS